MEWVFLFEFSLRIFRPLTSDHLEKNTTKTVYLGLGCFLQLFKSISTNIVLDQSAIFVVRFVPQSRHMNLKLIKNQQVQRMYRRVYQ